MRKRRVPVWVSVIPLALLVGCYYAWWSQKNDQFRTELTRAVGPVALQMGGFPYRLSADLGRVALHREGAASFVRVCAERMTIDRQPWRPALTVVGAEQPRVLAAIPALGGARLDIEAPHGRASVDTAFGRLARLSAEFEGARLWLGLMPAMGRASHLELHLRETPIAPIATPRGPGWPTQAEAVARATGLTFDDGAPLTMDATFTVTAPAPMTSVHGWEAQDGTVELRRLTLSDAHGVVVDANATAVPLSNGRLEVGGSLTTVCPRSVLAALARTRPPTVEYRARVAQRIAFGGVAGSVAATTDEAGLGAFTVRTQEAACPVLRR